MMLLVPLYQQQYLQIASLGEINWLLTKPLPQEVAFESHRGNLKRHGNYGLQSAAEANINQH